MRVLPAVAIAMSVMAGCLQPGAGEGRPPDFRGLVVAADQLAAEAGAEVLRAGGSAADAAAAVQWALTVVEPESSGIGGGSFILHMDGQTGDTVVLDGRETAPALTTADQFEDPSGLQNPDPTMRGTAVGVPGTVAVFAEAQARWGNLEWAETFGPALRLASEGFPVSPDLAEAIARNADRLRAWPASARLYLDGAVCPPDVAAISFATGCMGGEPLAAGAILSNPDLASTLATLATGGATQFYEGDIARDIVLTQAQRGGRMQPSDLSDYRVVEREPLRGDYRGYDIVTVPSPGGGPILLNMLEILEGYDRSGGPYDVDGLHRLVETMRLAYADRAAYNADPDVERVPQRGLASPAYAAVRRALIDDARRTESVAAGDPWPFEGTPGPPGQAVNLEGREMHTSSFLVVDAQGSIVSSTTTIEMEWGNGQVVAGRGFILNNQLTDFDLVPGGPNEPGPMKRPRSSMVPSIVLHDGNPILVVGAAGGRTITTSVLQVILHTIDDGMGVHDAVAAPRIYGPYSRVLWDEGFPTFAQDGLAAKGHIVAQDVDGISTLQAAAVEGGHWVGQADTRLLAGGVAFASRS